MFDLAAIEAKAKAPTRQELAYELCVALGGTLWLDGVPMPVLTAGKLCLLDAVESPLLNPDKKCNSRDADIALLILLCGADAVSPVTAHIYAGEPLDEQLEKLKNSIGDYSRDYFFAFFRQMFDVSIQGFAMIPGKSDSETMPMTFNAEWLSSYTAKICPATGLTIDSVIWDLPLAMGGFICASLARANGIKGVSRVLDDKAILNEIKRQMEAEKCHQK